MPRAVAPLFREIEVGVMNRDAIGLALELSTAMVVAGRAKSGNLGG
jgi:hypothetical protein